MNQIIQENLNQNANKFYQFMQNRKINNSEKQKFHIEFSDEIAEIPYGENYTISMKHENHKFQTLKNFMKQRKYQLQFLISCIIATVFLFLLFWKLYQNQQQEKIAKELLNNYQLTTLYSTNSPYETNKINSNVATQTPFVIGMIKIDKINLSYPILSAISDELLKVSLCRFAGPTPNETGNLCIAGHNYIDNRFFSNLEELTIGDLIEIYGLTGQKQEYHVVKKYEVDAKDLSCTNQNVGENKVVTLLTCNNSNNSKRLVIQAEE